MESIGKYKIIEELGRGGMGVIYRALDPDIHREVAVKIIRHELLVDGAQSDRSIRQFMIEAQAAGRLCNPNIATIYEVGRQKDLTYIVMQYIPGGSLRKALEKGRKFSVEEAVGLIVPICRALDDAHRAGIVHRDIKPDNILLDETDRPYLVDFGIATIESVDPTRTRMSSATPPYMSPEQVLETAIDGRSDIFSLGVVLFELIAGQRPFKGENIASLSNRIVSQEPDPLVPSRGPLPEGFEDVVLKALAKTPEERWSTAGEFADALAACLEPAGQATVVRTAGRVKTAPFPTVSRRKPKPARRLPPFFYTPAGTALGVAVAALALFGLLALGRRILGPEPTFENLIAVTPFESDAPDVPAGLIEFVLDRSLTASTKVPVLTRRLEDLAEAAGGIKARTPLVRVSGRIVPTLTGFEVDLTLHHKSVKSRKVFPCRGTLDFISTRIDEILAFLKANGGGDIGPIEGGRTFAAVCTSNWDALSHFLKGQQAWDKLDAEPAAAEFKTALEADPDFALARLRSAEVTLFLRDREDARPDAEAALQGRARLIHYDVLKAQAVLARINSNPAEERKNVQELKEAFPLKKEFLYEYAESYFHTGDGAEAEPYYAKALSLDGAYALAHNHIAYCYAWNGDHAKAEEHLLRYVDLDKTANSYDSLASGYMFAGRYAKAVEALDKGKALNAKVDYLYSNYAVNYEMLGSLGRAEECLHRYADVTEGESNRMNSQVNLAYVALLRGDAAEAERRLRPALEFYGGRAYAERLDDSPVLPLWLSGVLASRRGDAGRLRSVIAELARRAEGHKLNATNFFPLLKFLVHLKALEAGLKKDSDALLAAVDEAQRIAPKMGYWSSPFNRAYFLDEMARILLAAGSSSSKPKELLAAVLAYNASYPPALLRMARLLASEGDREGARRLCGQARTILAGADPGTPLAKELAAVLQLTGGRP